LLPWPKMVERQPTASREGAASSGVERKRSAARGLVAKAASLLLATVLLRFQQPAWDALPGGCAESATPTYRLDTVTLWGRWTDGDTYTLQSHPAGLPGAPDSFAFVAVRQWQSVWVTVRDSAGNESCPSNVVELGSLSVDPAPPDVRPLVPWVDVAGRRMEPGPSGVYFRRWDRKRATVR
jgi:hypothetical protein